MVASPVIRSMVAFLPSVALSFVNVFVALPCLIALKGSFLSVSEGVRVVLRVMVLD